MADRLCITGREGSEVDGLVRDGNLLFLSILTMCEHSGRDPLDTHEQDAVHFLASLGRDFLNEATRQLEKRGRA